ncbi:hydroxymethylglutaryl-CoA lyase [Fredinandcohnia onubensis]|uniref:hydroxymethylglutaryl-CoA lyase n=1 Tax=Fredinandcohnia onubensis TaxID=1571209 RepID=UPI000C0BD35B|nr:hydroxymethylglutaryl-CoA lyase [Fredinandcohnia onubensis]
MDFISKVELVEVCPRDGLQNLNKIYDTDTKVKLVNILSESGLKKIEVTGFVNPKVIPQLSDAEEVFSKIDRKSGVVYRGLVPNEYGAKRAIGCAADEILALICCSETYNRKNQNMTIQQSLIEMEKIISFAHSANTPVTIALALAFFCPYEGMISREKVLNIMEKIIKMGATKFYLATSSGMADPLQVYRLLKEIKNKWPNIEIGLHLHNRNGMALANVLASLNAGVTIFEGSILGLGGGIRMAGDHRVLGNVPQEDLIHLFNSMGIDCGIKIDVFLETVKKVEEILGYKSSSFVTEGGTRNDVLVVTKRKWG